MTKIERLEKQMYKEISKGNFEKARALMKKIVDIDVANWAREYGQEVSR